jgi:hypothetical protein
MQKLLVFIILKILYFGETPSESGCDTDFARMSIYFLLLHRVEQGKSIVARVSLNVS